MSVHCVQLIEDDSVPIQTSPTDLSYKQLPLELDVSENANDSSCVAETLSAGKNIADEQHAAHHSADGTTQLIKVPDFCLLRPLEDQVLLLDKLHFLSYHFCYVITLRG